jgi:hypothetical protein
MHMPTLAIQRACTGGAGCECEACKQQRLLRKGTQPTGKDAAPIGGEVLQAPGQPLDADTRAYMEPRFGANFSQVRVHTNTHAAWTASSINAKAFTVGRDITFAAGQYAPHTGEGQRLLAHELTHVVQQGNGANVMQRRRSHRRIHGQTRSASRKWNCA